MRFRLFAIGGAIGALAGIAFALPLMLGRIDEAAVISTAVIILLCVIIGCSFGIATAILMREKKPGETFLPQKTAKPISPMPLIVISIVGAAIGAISRIRLLLSADIHVDDAAVSASLIGLLIGTFIWVRLLQMLYKRSLARFEYESSLKSDAGTD